MKTTTFKDLKPGDLVWCIWNLKDWNYPEAYLILSIEEKLNHYVFKVGDSEGHEDEFVIYNLKYTNNRPWYTTKSGAYQGMIRQSEDFLKDIEKDLIPLQERRRKLLENLESIKRTYDRFLKGGNEV